MQIQSTAFESIGITMESNAVSHHDAIAKINMVCVSTQDMLAVADAANTFVATRPEAFGKPVDRAVIEGLFGENSSKALAVEARMLALRHMVKRGKVPAWLAPSAIDNQAIGKALLEAVANEPIRFDGRHFCFDADHLCNRVLELAMPGGQG